MSDPPVDAPKDPWPRVLSLPERFVGDPASLARDNIFVNGNVPFSRIIPVSLLHCIMCRDILFPRVKYGTKDRKRGEGVVTN